MRNHQGGIYLDARLILCRDKCGESPRREKGHFVSDLFHLRDRRYASVINMSWGGGGPKREQISPHEVVFRPVSRFCSNTGFRPNMKIISPDPPLPGIRNVLFTVNKPRPRIFNMSFSMMTCWSVKTREKAIDKPVEKTAEMTRENSGEKTE